MTENTNEKDIAFETLQQKSERDDEAIEILHAALKTEKQKKFNIAALSIIGVPITSIALAMALTGNENIAENTNTPEQKEVVTYVKTLDTPQITHVKLYYQKDGEKETFKFSFAGDPDGEYPTKHYFIGNDGLDEFLIRLYDFYQSDPDELGYDTYTDLDLGSLAKNDALRDTIVKEALKAGFIEQTGLTELPASLRSETNNAHTAPGQRVDWTIDIDGGKNDALEIQYTNKTSPRELEHINHRISLKDKTYCTESYSKYSFNNAAQRNEETCQKLDDMDKNKRDTLFSQFNAQKLFDINNHDQKDAVISSKTVGNKTTYAFSWAKK